MSTFSWNSVYHHIDVCIDEDWEGRVYVQFIGSTPKRVKVVLLPAMTTFAEIDSCSCGSKGRDCPDEPIILSSPGCYQIIPYWGTDCQHDIDQRFTTTAMLTETPLVVPHSYVHAKTSTFHLKVTDGDTLQISNVLEDTRVAV